MAKTKPPPKAKPAAEAGNPEPSQTTAQPEQSQTVMGRHVAGSEVQEHGHPEAGAGQIVTYTETDYSLVFPDEITEPQFLTVAQKLGEAAAGLGWRVGDLANFGKA